MKDILFLMKPGFMDGERGPLYCGDSVGVEGLLSFFPSLRDDLDVRYIEPSRPRAPVVALIGEANQSIPVLVLADAQVPKPDDVVVGSGELHRFINDPDAIRHYLSSRYGIATQG